MDFAFPITSVWQSQLLMLSFVHKIQLSSCIVGDPLCGFPMRKRNPGEGSKVSALEELKVNCERQIHVNT